MRSASPARLSLPLLAGALAGGCGYHAAPPPAPRPPALPELSAPPPAPAPLARARPGATADPLAGRPPGNPVTLSARNVDVSVLLVALAEHAGLSLIVDPTVNARTSVNFTDVPAVDALRAVLAAAGLSLASGPPVPPVGATVFYAVPVDIDRASAALIAEHFRVSPEVAEWIVESRTP